MKLRNSLSALVVASVLVVTAGCAAAEPPQSASSDGGSGSGTGTDSTQNGDAGETSDEVGDDGGDRTGDDKLTLEECLPGNWYVDNVSFGKLMSDVAGGAVDDVTGVVMLTMRADGTTQTLYEDWKHTITVDSATITIIKNGTDYGTYEVHGDGTVSMIDTEITSDTTSVMNLGGKMVSHTVTPEPSVFSQSSFTCSGDELAVTADGGTTILHREH